MKNNDKIFDSTPPRQSQSRRNDDQAWIRLAATYLHDLPQQLERVRATLKAKDYTTIKEQAHRIKGTSGTYRLDTISKSAAELENLADRRNSDAIAAAINKVMQLVKKETKKLNSQLVGPPTNPERKANG